MRKFFGGLLLAIGILIAGVSGLCTLFFLKEGGAAVLMIGGIPIVIGVGLIVAGNALIKDRGGLPPPPHI